MAGAAEAALSGPPVALSTGPLGVVQSAGWEIGRQQAAQYRAVAEFARCRPASVDRQPGEPGCASAASRAARPDVLTAVSEWAAQELCVALSIGQRRADQLLEHALLLVDRLPATLLALEAGTLHAGHLAPLLEHVAPIADHQLRARVEAELLGWLGGRVKTPAQLADRTRRVVLRCDATAAARQLEKALRSRGIYLTSGREPGMESLLAVLTTPEARACLQVLGAYADLIEDPMPDGDGPAPPPRSRAQKMADVLLDLILRPGTTDLPPVQATFTVVASVETLAGGDAPGEIDGQTVPAEMVRHLARSFGLLPDPVAAPTPGAAPSAAAPGQVTADHRDTGPNPIAAEAVAAPAAAAMAAPAVAVRGDRAMYPPVVVEEAEWLIPEHDMLLTDAWPPPDWPAGTEQEPYRAEPGSEPLTDGELAFIQAIWAEEAKPVDQQRWPIPEQLLDPPPARSGNPPPGGDGTGSWAAADAVVAAASDLTRRAADAVAEARRSVRAAETATTADEVDWARSPAGQLSRARTTVDALTALDTHHRQAIADLLTRTGGGGLTDRPRIAVVDALTGTLLALTDAPELRRLGTCGRDGCTRRRTACTHDLTRRPGLGAPPDSPGYRPGARLDRFVRARDRRCRFPGCRNRIPRTDGRGGELDHRIRYPDGPTSAGNLAGHCIRHHRGKHQAPGWHHELHPDGTLTVTTPTGLTTTTEPEDHTAMTAAGNLNSVQGVQAEQGRGADISPHADSDPAPF